MVGGRPRTVSPSDEELEKLGQQMLDFVSNKENNVLHLSEWWSTEMFFVEKVWDTICRHPKFFPYYEKALRIIGKKYLDKTSKVRDGISHRWQRIYFKDLKKQEDEDADEAEKRKSQYQLSTAISPNQSEIDKDDEIMKLKYEKEQLKEKLEKLERNAN